MAERRRRHPPFVRAVLADTRMYAKYRGAPLEDAPRHAVCLEALRLAASHDCFSAQACYRAKARLQALGVPVVPAILHRAAIMIAQVCIGDPVVMAPGVYMPHGQVVIDGLTEVGHGVVLTPFVTIGLVAGDMAGPTVGPHVHVGTGAKILGPVAISNGAVIGANAVVVEDVAARTTVVGLPARAISSKPPVATGSRRG